MQFKKIIKTKGSAHIHSLQHLTVEGFSGA